MTDPQANQTNLTNPPQTQTKMTAPKLTKCRAVHPIDSKYHGRIINPGEEVDLPEHEVAEFCDKRFKGVYSHTGEVSKKNAGRQLLRRAIRMTEVKEIERRNEELAKMKAAAGGEDDVSIEGEAS